MARTRPVSAVHGRQATPSDVIMSSALGRYAMLVAPLMRSKRPLSLARYHCTASGTLSGSTPSANVMRSLYSDVEYGPPDNFTLWICRFLRSRACMSAMKPACGSMGPGWEPARRNNCHINSHREETPLRAVNTLY